MLGGDSDDAQIIELTEAAAGRAVDALIIYYAGHGLADEYGEDRLYLATPRSARAKASYTALAFDHLRRIVNMSKAERKVIVLDCCLGGLAITGRMSARGRSTAGMAILTASSEKSVASSPPSEWMSAFTSELVHLVIEGLVSGPPQLDLATIFVTVAQRLVDRGRPRPAFGSIGAGATIALARNHLYRANAVVADVPPEAVAQIRHLILEIKEGLRQVDDAAAEEISSRLDEALRLVGPGEANDGGRLTAAYAELARAHYFQPAPATPSTETTQSTGGYADQVRELDGAVEDLLRHVGVGCDRVLPHNASEAAALADGLGRSAALAALRSGSDRLRALAEEYARGLARRILDRLRTDQETELDLRYAHLIAKAKCMAGGSERLERERAFPWTAAGFTNDDRQLRQPNLPARNRWLDDDMVRLLTKRMITQFRAKGAGELLSRTVWQRAGDSMSQVLLDPETRASLIEAITRRVRAILEEDLAPLRRRLGPGGNSEKIAYLMERALGRIERVLADREEYSRSSG
jgi:hypothetical protein